MPTARVKARVDQPPKAVFDFVADTCNDPKWAPLVDAAEQVIGEGPGEGAAYDVVQRTGSGRATVRLFIVAFDRPCRVSWSMQAKGVRYRSTITVQEDHNGGSVVRQSNELRFDQWWIGPLWWLMAQRIMRRQLRLLRHALDEDRTE